MKKKSSKGGGGGGKYVSGGYLTSTGRLYASKPGPKGSYNNKSINNGGNEGH